MSELIIKIKIVPSYAEILREVFGNRHVRFSTWYFAMPESALLLIEEGNDSNQQVFLHFSSLFPLITMFPFSRSLVE